MDITKRIVLSFIAWLFDPLSFTDPFLMQAKCLFQDMWKSELSWYVEIPTESTQVFARCISELHLLNQWSIPRNYTDQSWCNVKSVQLYRFGDASPKG